MDKAAIGIIGGSGLYGMEQLVDREPVDLDTPFGKPSAPPLVGTLAGKKVAFVARHGNGHTLTPSEVNYRANIHVLKQLGVRFILAVSACGSLKEQITPGSVVVPDQLLDFTRGQRRNSFFGEGVVAHVGTAEPFCGYLRAILVQAAGQVDRGNVEQSQADERVHDGGTFITVEGPRFSTRAESALFRSWGLDIIGMTTSPEAFLAREAEISYAVLAHVTDFDVWHDEPVSNELVVRTFQKNIARTQATLARAVELLDTKRITEAHRALDGAVMTAEEHQGREARYRLSLLLDRLK
ncbi:MAG TPA: S-methyl-5'-thioadenosine phosphorylase [Spirochaetia bacterium]|nr:S-methyl-5'-thioadenosine phosphorylase [Spirochaetia bacterium]